MQADTSLPPILGYFFQMNEHQQGLLEDYVEAALFNTTPYSAPTMFQLCSNAFGSYRLASNTSVSQVKFAQSAK